MQLLYENTSGLETKNVLNTAESLVSYIQKLKQIKQGEYNIPESCLNVVSDTKYLAKVIELIKKYKSQNLKYVFLLGIGGSNLGAKAIYDSFYGFKDTYLPKIERYPKLLFLDTVNPKFFDDLNSFLKTTKLNSEEYLINIITKSGSTTETIYNAEMLLKILPNSYNRIVITSDKDSVLTKKAQEKNIEHLEVPKMVGGRFSVFSAVGLFPLAICNIDIGKLLKGALDAKKQNLEDDITKNLAAISASSIYLNYKKNIFINDTYIYNPELESLGKWYRQLMAESLGKDNLKILPTVSVGSADLHSITQRYLGGEHNIFTTFLRASTPSVSENIKLTETKLNIIEDSIKNKAPNNIVEAIYEGVKKSYKNKNIPYIEVTLETVDEYNLGYYMQFKMIEMMYLGKLFNVNTFNQPNVEEYKVETKKILIHEK